MNSRRFSNLLALLICVAMAYAYLARGAHARLYFLPLAAILIMALALFLTGLNRGLINFQAVPEVELPLLFFLGWLALSYFRSVDRETTSFEVARTACLIAVFFIVAHGLEPRGKLAILAMISIIGVIEALLGIYQMSMEGAFFSLPYLPDPPLRRLNGTLINKNHLAGLMEMSLFSSLAFLPLFRQTHKAEGWKIAARAVTSLCAVFILLGLVFSLSRGGWISAAGGSLVFAALIRTKKRMRSLAIVAVLAAILMAGIFLFRLDTSSLQRKVSSLGTALEGDEMNLTSRFSLWRSSAAMAWDHPLLGVGWGAFRDAYPSYRRGDVLRGAVFAHNDYLQICSTTGVPGLIFFMAFLAATLVKGVRLSRHHRGFGPKLAPGVVAGLVAIMIHETVDFNLMLPANAIAFFCLAAMASSSWEEKA